MSWRIEHGDCRKVMARLDAGSVDAIVTDAPYGLEFMGKAWDSFGTPRAFQEWCESWAREALRVLKPGGYLLNSCGTRTYHRMACGVEDAGFAVRDMLSWLYGQGWPKDKLTQLKPACEPAVLARKPLVGTIAENALAHGTGALNIDACRIGVSKDDPNHRQPSTSFGSGKTQIYGNGLGGRPDPNLSSAGRWPANVLLDEEAAALLDEQAGERKSGSMRAGVYAGAHRTVYSPDAGRPLAADIVGSTGGASRFFYVAKASSSERDVNGAVDNDHPTVKPVALMRWLCRLVTPPGGLVLDPFCGSGTTGIAALQEGFDFIGIELEAPSVELARRRIVGDNPLFNRNGG
jgi:DNA methylase